MIPYMTVTVSDYSEEVWELLGGNQNMILRYSPLNFPQSLVIGSGYNYDGSFEVLSKNTTVATIGQSVQVTTTVPAADAQEPEYSTRYTSAVIEQSLNLGWNSSARSINELSSGSYIEYTLAKGNQAAHIGIGAEGGDGLSYHNFSHGLVVDVDGIKVVEGGAIVATLATSYDSDTRLRIYRHADRTIVYVAITGTKTTVYTSKKPFSLAPFTPAYAYGRLYASGDKVTSAAFQSGSVAYGSM